MHSCSLKTPKTDTIKGSTFVYISFSKILQSVTNFFPTLYNSVIPNRAIRCECRANIAKDSIFQKRYNLVKNNFTNGFVCHAPSL